LKKALILIFAILAFYTSEAQKSVFNYTDYKELGKFKKPYYIEFYTQWCGYCKQMEKETFSDSKTIQLSAKLFNASKIDAESKEGKELAAKYKIEGFPTVVFFSDDGKVIGRNEGYLDPNVFKRILNEMYLDALFHSDKFTQFIDEKNKAMDKIVQLYKKSSPSNYEKSENAIKLGEAKDEVAFNKVLDETDFKQRGLLQIWYYMGEKNKEKLISKINAALKEKTLNPVQMHVLAWFLIKNKTYIPEVLKLLDEAEKIGAGAEEINTKAVYYLFTGNFDESAITAAKAVEQMKKMRQNYPHFYLIEEVLKELPHHRK
jgi:thioredoxin-related protein